MTTDKPKRPWQDPPVVGGALFGFMALVILSRAGLDLPPSISVFRGFFGLALWCAIAYGITRPWFFDRIVGEATPGALGAIRALVCGRLFMMVVMEDLNSIAYMPDTLRGQMGLMTLFYRFPIYFEHFLDKSSFLSIFQIVTLIFLFLGTIGWRTRLTVPVGGFGAFMVAGVIRQYTFFWHQDLIALYMVALLSLTPCGDGFSLDRLIGVARGRPGPNSAETARIYGWSRYACFAILSLAYFAAGMSKLRNGGLFWWNGITMRRILLTDTLNPMQFDWGISLRLAPLPTWMFSILGFSGVFGEVSYGLALVWPKARKYLAMMMASMHIGIIFLQNILFMDLILFQIIMFDLTTGRKWLGRHLRKWFGRVEILYDGQCQLCRRTMDILRRLDLFERLTLTDFRMAGTPPSLTMDELAGEMHIIKNGRVFKGFEGYRRLATVLPLGWFFTPLLWLPGVSSIGAKIYEGIAKKRSGTLYCGTTHCRFEPAATVARPAARPRPASYHAAMGAAGIIAVMLFCWIFQIEYFPLTALEMYSTPKWHSTAPITFFKMRAVRESGSETETAFQSVVGGLFARNSRYRPVIKRCFNSPADAVLCRVFLTIRGNAYNRRMPPGRRVTTLEVQKWMADWDNPRNQRMVDVFTVNLAVPDTALPANVDSLR